MIQPISSGEDEWEDDLMSPQADTHLDANAAAGELSEIFAVDVTVAVGRCSGCGRTGPLAESLLYGSTHGLVARCPTCDTVLLRLVSGPGRSWLNLRGLSYLQLARPQQ
jgi:Family of unknown function (DUF6510)